MAFLPVDARRLRRGVPTACLFLLVLLSLLAFIACEVLNQPESVPTFSDNLEAADYLIERYKYIANKANRVMMISMAAGQGSCATKMASLAADVQDLERAFFATPAGSAYLQLVKDRWIQDRIMVETYIENHGYQELGNHLNKHANIVDRFVSACG